MKCSNGFKHPIIIVDDEDSILLSMDTTLRMAGFNNIITCNDSRRVMELISKHHAEVILLDLKMPHLSGQELLETITEDYPEIPVIIFTGTMDVDTAVHCMKKGAFYYLVKPVEAERLVTTVKKASEFRELQRENSSLKNYLFNEELKNSDAFRDIITNNRNMFSVFRYIDSIARSSQVVLITGETGVGKELVAKTIHTLSGRSGPFVTVNVAGLDDNVFSDTLFGHAKGAFTGADQLRKGLVEQASGGTLLLDEIGDLSLSSQVKLLRLLQEGEYRSVGMDNTKKCNTRIITSTNESLNALQKVGRFRKDLLYRLRIHHVRVPALRERLDDIPLLLEYFLEQAANSFKIQKPSAPKELVDLLQTFSFPGNIRELRSIIFDAVSNHKSGILSMSGIKKYIERQRNSTDVQVSSDNTCQIVFPANLPTIEVANQELVKEAMRRSKGNQSMAASLLGISQQAVNKRLKKIKLNSSE
ncbi:sigma-54 dependent transcriptional regulator [bacterium]|nr:sigma-54 dependent transcriptional regulator [bacterium]